MEPAPIDFPSLKAARRALNDVCKRHVPSVITFAAPEERPWFLLVPDEQVPKGSGEDPHHLSSSASCLQSLLLARARETSDLRSLIDRFSSGALAREESDWKSEGAAHTYCRVRTLPLILEEASNEILVAAEKKIVALTRFAWTQVRAEEGFEGIREHGGKAQGPDYPPNAFLTYWGLRTLDGLARIPATKDARKRLSRRRGLAVVWAGRALGAQIGLAGVESDQVDPHQLAWALMTVLRFSPQEYLRRPATIDLLGAALGSLFALQQKTGGWPQGQPLFHYPQSGNAYCYTYETFAELLGLAVQSQHAKLRDLLRPYANNLLQAFQVADRTGQELGNGAVGWSSYHHPHRVVPESWATASVFAFLENLRCLVGVWTTESARDVLGVRTPTWPIPAKATEVLRERGDTWPVDGWSVAERISALFIHPTNCHQETRIRIDPDEPLVEESCARSAILFGPPGTSKTTLVEAVAGVLGWNYLEVHASDFLTGGMDQVASRADAIFQLIMELDHCVVLFDEIDELLRDRARQGSDPFGRFLTTSMLPKIAKLWEQRRVLFFVNTNWIDRADPAITRSQRFDAALLVLPPSFERKLRAIEDLLSDDARNKLTKDAVDSAVKEDDNALGWFALLRQDQLSELRSGLRLASEGRGQSSADFDDLKIALGRLGDRLKTSDWMPVPDRDDGVATPFERYRALAEFHHFDHSKKLYAKLRVDIEGDLEGDDLVECHDGKTCSVISPEAEVVPETLSLADLVLRHVGLVEYTKSD